MRLARALQARVMLCGGPVAYRRCTCLFAVCLIQPSLKKF